MKKLISIIIFVAIVVCMTIPVFAENYDQDDTEGQTDFKLELGSPTYTVTIPTMKNLAIGDNFLPIEVSDAQNLNGKSIVITFESTQAKACNSFYPLAYSLILWRDPVPTGVVTMYMSDYSNWVNYYLYDENGVQKGEKDTIISFHNRTPYVLDAGKILASYTKDGIKQIKMYIPPENVDHISTSVEYSGYIVFGIGVE